MHILFILGGIILLLVGGEGLVKGSVTVARKLGMSPLVIGIVLVGFGTSAPEMVTCVLAALHGSPGIAVGNVIGSNIANILLIIGTASTIASIPCNPKAFYRDGIALAGATIICVAALMTGEVTRMIGVVFLIILACYLGYTIRTERKPCYSPSGRVHEEESHLLDPVPGKLVNGLIMAVSGMAAIMFGAKLVVDGAVELARAMEISETLIGLTVISIGTSLPELVASAMAAFRRQTELAFGNILGSNMFNTLGILGSTAVIAPIPVPPEILEFDLWVMAAVTLIFLIVSMRLWMIVRVEGFILLGCYACYLGWLVTHA